MIDQPTPSGELQSQPDLPETSKIECRADVTPENERRSAIDPLRTRMTIQEKAALVSTSRFKGKSPVEGIGDERFTEDYGRYGLKFREALQNVLHRLEIPEFIASIEAQYDSALAVWTDKYPIDVKNVPFRNYLTEWLSRFSPKTICGLQTLGANTLVLVPPMRAKQLIKVLDDNKLFDDIGDAGNAWPRFWNRVGTDEWEFGITNVETEASAGQEEFNQFRNRPIEEVIKEIYFPGRTIVEKIGAAMRANSRNANWESFFEYAQEETPANPDYLVKEYKRIYGMMGVGIMPAHGYIAAFATKSTAERTIDDDHDCYMDLNSYTLFEKPPGTGHLFPTAGSVSESEPWLHLSSVSDNPNENPQYMSNYGCRPWVES